MGNARTLIVWALVVTFSASMMLADPGTNAMMYTSGAVVVNGTGAAGTAAVFAGDKIRTADSSAARISMPGSTIIVPSNSALMYSGKSVELNAGQVEINTTNGMAAKVAGLTISPATNGTARFQVAMLEGAVAIAAERGALTINDGETNTVVQEGSTQTTDEPQAPGPQQKKKKKKGGAVPLPGAGQGAGGVFKTIAVAGGATAGIVLAIKTTGPPESKDRR